MTDQEIPKADEQEEATAPDAPESKQPAQTAATPPSAASTTVVVLITIFVVLGVVLLSVLLFSRAHDRRQVREQQSDADEITAEVEEEETTAEDEPSDAEEEEEVDVTSTPEGMVRYTNDYYGFTLLYDEDYTLCLNDFCDNNVADEDIQHVKISDPDDYDVGNEFYLRVDELESERTADEFAEAAVACVEKNEHFELVSTTPDANVYGYDAYWFAVEGGFCDEGYVYTQDGKIADGDGYQGFVFDGELRVGYVIIDGNLFRGIMPNEAKFNQIWESLALTHK